jgi:hypothetical protein
MTMSQTNPSEASARQDGPDLTGGVGEHMPETPDAGDVDHLEGEYGELDKLVGPEGGDGTTSGDEPIDVDGP